MKVSIGRFGPYAQHDKLFASLGKEKDPYTITFDEAVQIIKDKQVANDNKVILNFEAEGIQVLKGQYGPYIKKDKDNYKIPKDKTAEYLTLEDVMMIIGDGPTKKSFRRGGKAAASTETKAPAKKAATKKKAAAKKKK